ncbi:hypothetical protein NOGI109294_02410 [Nocardiopsis gilva]|uniref:hypothetical protein n=1 Tax=Nocardiopsis gilva TaxID=280236 RepID=UPI001268975B|nr:hypothetical protein [Nocardiopsis gilva]
MFIRECGYWPGWRAWWLRASTGVATPVLNVWDSVFTTAREGHLRWEVDAGGVLLHAIAPVLLILLADAATR